jgi:hypothetical protein
MTLLEFRDVLLTADPQASHYSSMLKPNYTKWAEYGEKVLYSDGESDEKHLLIQVDRFTTIEYDPVVDAIRTAFDRDDIAYEYSCDFEPDTGYIHHIWDCEVA